MSDGTTAVTAVIKDGCIYVANAGDSRAIVVQSGGLSKHLSVDHKPNRYVRYIPLIYHNIILCVCITIQNNKFALTVWHRLVS